MTARSTMNGRSIFWDEEKKRWFYEDTRENIEIADLIEDDFKEINKLIKIIQIKTHRIEDHLKILSILKTS